MALTGEILPPLARETPRRVSSENTHSSAGIPRSAAASSAPPRPSASESFRPSASASSRPPAAQVGAGRRFARGLGRFWASLWQPFAHATSVLTLEITGVFFGLFTLFFFSHAWQIYRSGGWHDKHFDVYAGFGMLFGWFAVSSFWRARRKVRR